VKFSSSEQEKTDVIGRSYTSRVDARERLYPAAGVVCPSCGARIGKPCVSTVPFLGFGEVGTPIEGVHAERIAAAHEQGVA